MQVLAADVTFGYHSSFCRLKSVNKIEIQNIYHLAEVCDTCTDEFLQFDMDRSAPSILFCKHSVYDVRWHLRHPATPQAIAAIP